MWDFTLKCKLLNFLILYSHFNKPNDSSHVCLPFKFPCNFILIKAAQ